MTPEEIDNLKYADLRHLAKSVGIRANLKADKLRSALTEYYSKSEQGEGFQNEEPELEPKSKTPTLIKKQTPTRTRTPQVQKQAHSAKRATPNGRQTSQDTASGKRKECTGKKTEQNSVKRKRTETCENKDVGSPKKHKRSSTYDVAAHNKSNTATDVSNEDISPGVKQVVDSLTDDMTSEQMKDTLMQAIDKRAKEKVEMNVPVPDGPETHIPRFTALSAVRTYSSKKPITPANRDWEKIHQKQFDKMQGLDSYLANKKQRGETLSQSMKKMRLLTQQMRFAVDSVKQYKTPPSLLKGRTIANKPVAKPASSTQNKSKALFQSPAAKPFVPTVTSVSKTNFSFSAMSKPTKSPAPKKTPSSTKRKVNKVQTPVAKTTTPAKPIKSPNHAHRLSHEPVRRSPRLSGIRSPLPDNDESPTISFKPSATQSSTKENRKLTVASAKKSSVTPFRFNSTLNKSYLNVSHNTSASKPKFDLRASLARKVTWKPHSGKLQPLKVENIYSQPLGVKQATAATKATAKKDNRRKLEQRARADRRLDQQMRRRGIVP